MDYWVGAKPNDKCPYKTQRGETQRGKHQVNNKESAAGCGGDVNVLQISAGIFKKPILIFTLKFLLNTTYYCSIYSFSSLIMFVDPETIFLRNQI